MQKRSVGEVNITITEELVEVSLNANQYCQKRLEQYQFFLMQKRNLFAGKIIQVSEKELIIQYQKNKHIQSLSQLVKRREDFERLLLAQKINCLVDFMNTPIQPFLHLDNLFLIGEELMIAHRGFMQEIVPYTLAEKDFLQQYRTLVFAILYPELKEETLLANNEVAKEKFFKTLYCAESVPEIQQIIGEQINKQKEKRAKKLRLVNKKTYFIFKWTSLVFSLSTIGFSLMIEHYVFHRFPQQERISHAKSQYILSDYTGVLTTLKKDSPEKLSPEVQYVAAASSIQLDNLTESQKNTILATLSQKVNEALLYWVYIGKGNFYKSLELAKIIADDEYLLHVYTKLHTKIKTNVTMNSNEKQKLLLEYETKIEHYTKKLGEEKAET